jgi:hypothetical protein
MDVLSVPKTIARLEYSALRLPLALVESQVLARFLEQESGIRLGFEKALGSLDVTVGRWIGDDRRASRGAALSRKAEVLTSAVQLEQEAASRKEQAAGDLRQAKDKAQRRRTQAEQRATADLRAVRTEQQSDTRAARQKAQATSRAKTQAVERDRTTKLDAEQRRLDAQVSTVAARTAARSAAPKAQLKDATTRSQSARQDKQAANRLGRLADAEKVSRQDT